MHLVRNAVILGVVAATAVLASSPPTGAAEPDRSSTHDPATVSLAADRHIPLAEAAERMRWQEQLVRFGPGLEKDLGADFAGAWIDVADGDRIKLALTSDASSSSLDTTDRVLSDYGVADAADVVRQSRSRAELEKLSDALGGDARASDQAAPHKFDLAVGIDDSRNAVVVNTPTREFITARQSAFAARARQTPGAIVAEKNMTVQKLACGIASVASGSGYVCDAPLRGGTLMTTSNVACTVGFYVKSKTDGKPYFLTAGHCFSSASTVTGFTNPSFPLGSTIGKVHAYRNDSSGDHAIVSIDNTTTWQPKSWVTVHPNASSGTTLNDSYPITYDGAAYGGQRICASGGRSSFTKCGTTPSTPEWSINGQPMLVVHSMCGFAAGDSGGPVYASGTAYGVLAGVGGVYVEGDECALFATPIRYSETNLNVDVVWGL